MSQGFRLLALLATVFTGTMARAQAIPDLSQFDYSTRQSIEMACITDKMQGGPTAYGLCVDRQLEQLRNSPGVPPLSAYDYSTRQSLELACITEKTNGPAAYGQCLRSQLSAMQAGPAMPDISRFDYGTRQSLERSCLADKMSGPAAYSLCLNGRIDALRNNPGGVERYGASSAPSRPTRPPPSPAPSGSQSSARPPSGEPFAGAKSWGSVAKKPAMPTELNTEALTPEKLFSALETSVYVLVSAPSEQHIRGRHSIRQGSAVAVTSQVALTNCHVLRGNNVHFLLKGKKVMRAALAYEDADSDRCAVQVASASLIPVRAVRRYSEVAVGERVYSIGSPSGLENTLGEGIVSGLRQRNGLTLIQTTAPISPGSSGGGLFDAAGNLLGITTFLLRDSQNLNFAISADAYWN